MNAYATKPNRPFISKGTLERTPASERNRKMSQFLESHDFSFSVDRKTKSYKCTVRNKLGEK